MFRRREEGLFDNNDSAQAAESHESNVASQAPAAAHSAPVPPGQQSRFAPEAARSASAAQPPASNFRPASQAAAAPAATSVLPAELTRNRMPETKAPAASASAASSATTAVFAPSVDRKSVV